MSDLVARLGEIHMTVQIKRKATGKIDTYDLMGIVERQKEKDNGGNPLDCGERRGN